MKNIRNPILVQYEEFLKLESVVEAIDNNTIQDLKNKYRQNDLVLLLIDYIIKEYES